MLKAEWRGLVDDVKKLSEARTWLYLIRHFTILSFALLLVGIAVNFFFKPAKIASGGFTGIAMLVNYVWPNGLSIAKITTLLNVPFLLIGLPLLGRRFILHSLTGIAALYAAVEWTSFLRDLHQYHVSDPWLAVVFGGGFLGLGVGIAFKIGGNTAGVDLVALINRYFTNMKLGYTLLFVDSSVVLASFYILYKQYGSLHNGFYTLVEIFIYSTVARLVLEGVSVSQTVTIISRQAHLITTQVQKEMGRGVTILNGRGAYTGDEREVLYVALSPRELPLLQKIVNQADPQAFMVVQNVRDISGKGFTMEEPKAPAPPSKPHKQSA